MFAYMLILGVLVFLWGVLGMAWPRRFIIPFRIGFQSRSVIHPPPKGRWEDVSGTQQKLEKYARMDAGLRVLLGGIFVWAAIYRR